MQQPCACERRPSKQQTDGIQGPCQGTGSGSVSGRTRTGFEGSAQHNIKASRMQRSHEGGCNGGMVAAQMRAR